MGIDEFLELARSRRSIRRFKPDPVPDRCIENILDAARWAMSGSNAQPWEFIVVRDLETKIKLAKAGDEQGRLSAAIESSRVPEMRHPSYRDLGSIPKMRIAEAPVLIVVCADPRTAQTSLLRLFDRRWIIDENIANVTQMIHLAAAACGLGSQWVTVAQYYEELIKPILGVPPIIRIPNIVPVGYPASRPENAYRRDLSEMVHYEKYDMSKLRSHKGVQEYLRRLREVSTQGHSK